MVVDRVVRTCTECGKEFELLYCKVEDYIYKQEIKSQNGKSKIAYFCSYSCRQAYRRENGIDPRTNRKRCKKGIGFCKTG